jgi:hypothetical protein
MLFISGPRVQRAESQAICRELPRDPRHVQDHTQRRDDSTLLLGGPWDSLA